jgi:hypothetical protein
VLRRHSRRGVERATGVTTISTMTAPSRRVSLIHNLEHSEAATALFASRVVEDGLAELSLDAWPTQETTAPELGRRSFRLTAQGRETVLLEDGDVIVLLTVVNGWANAQVAGRDASAVAKAMRLLREALPVPDPSAAHEVTVTFWTYGPHGPMPSFRTVAVPGWDEIRENYSAETRAHLEQLMVDFHPAHGGQLVLWHGQAGTGKTFALRALAWEWRAWCELHYIVDPDSFFGAHADYLMNVLVHEPFTLGAAWQSHIHELQAMTSEIVATTEDDARAAKPWRLLVLEDTGELLTPDAKAVIGQGLSRFLNVVDGLIGQGLRVLVLVTTNEPVRTLHPAVARPGRCAANVEFTPLSEREATAWLEAHDLAPDVRGERLLASLYARAAGLAADEITPSMGFADSRD